MAEHLFRQRVGGRRGAGGGACEAASAGVGAIDGMQASPETLQVLARDGIDAAAHRARRLTAELAMLADLILVMDAGHARQVLECAPAAAGKVHLLKTYGLPAHHDAHRAPDIPDPIGRPMEVYEACYATIKEAVRRVADQVCSR